jgi:hypothetical protein
VTHSLASGLLNSRLTSFIAALVLACVIGSVDVATGYEIGLGLFYLLPIALATSRIGKRAHERERSRARRDFLTQTANAETFSDMSGIEIERARAVLAN